MFAVTSILLRLIPSSLDYWYNYYVKFVELPTFPMITAQEKVEGYNTREILWYSSLLQSMLICVIVISHSGKMLGYFMFPNPRTAEPILLN